MICLCTCVSISYLTKTYQDEKRQTSIWLFHIFFLISFKKKSCIKKTSYLIFLYTLKESISSLVVLKGLKGFVMTV